MSAITGPAWDLSTEYQGFTDEVWKKDWAESEQAISQLETFGEKISQAILHAESLKLPDAKDILETARQAHAIAEKVRVLIENMYTFASCRTSVDGTDADAKAALTSVQSLWAKTEQALSPLNLLLKLVPEEFATAYLDHPDTKSSAFLVQRERTLRPHALSLAEEDLIIALGVDGQTAWGNLYDNLAGTVPCEVDGKMVGLAKAAALQEDADRATREKAYRAINRTWQGHEESVASILNALSGWRHTVYRKRSHTKAVHFMDSPLHLGRLEKETLDTMMRVTEQKKAIGQSVVKGAGKLLKIDKMAPWDLFAPLPADVTSGGETKIPFAKAIQLIKDAFGSIDGSMADFVQMMADNNWIEGQVLDKKRPGAYCTGFAKSRTPRVYMTYTGGMREVMTLAHELGHAFHNWVMRDLPLAQYDYPMTLAETASIFAETVVAGYLEEQAKSDGDRLNLAFTEAKDIEALTINIPARYHFERAFYEKRRERQLGPAELSQLMKEAWQTWYGDSLSEYNEMFWASKLHFSISELSFYNFPYLFGYLFSLGVYAQREKLGNDFFASYRNLLRDTGRMTAEEVATKHLQVDLKAEQFWLDSMKIVAQKSQTFLDLLD